MLKEIGADSATLMVQAAIHVKDGNGGLLLFGESGVLTNGGSGE